MNQNPFENKLSQPKTPDIPNQEKLAVRIEIATEKDWKVYKEIRLLALSSKDAEMLGFSYGDFFSEKTRDEEEWRRDLSRNDMFIVLSWSGSDVVGMGHAVRESPDVWSMTYDYVKESFRKMGIQKRMLAERLREIKKRGGLKVTGIAMTNNTATIRANEFFGFKKTGTISIKVDEESRSAYTLELDLTDSEVTKKINEILNAR